MESNINIIVRFLSQAEDEDIVEKVNTLIKEGVGLGEIQIDMPERKRSYGDNIPGVVIVNCKSAENKKLIMVRFFIYDVTLLCSLSYSQC